MKEKLKEFILQKLGGKLPDDPCQDTIKVCGIKVFNADSFDKEFRIIDKYIANSLSVGVFYSAHQAQVELSINGNLTDGYGSFALSISKLDDGLESLVKLMRAGVIQLTGYPASEHPQFNDEDKVDHRSAPEKRSKQMADAEKAKIDKFINETERFTYGCDGGCLAMFVNGIRFSVLNCEGDGEGTVYILHGNHIEKPCPLDDELIANFGWCREDTDPPIEIKFSDCDILLDENHIVHTIKANRISISRIVGTCDFVFRCLD